MQEPGEAVHSRILTGGGSLANDLAVTQIQTCRRSSRQGRCVRLRFVADDVWIEAASYPLPGPLKDQPDQGERTVVLVDVAPT